MISVWKFPLVLPSGSDRVAVRMPDGAEILTLDTQHGDPCIWARVDTLNMLVARTFVVCGTGHEAPDPADSCWVGTFLLGNGLYVFHVFELLESG